MLQYFLIFISFCILKNESVFFIKNFIHNFSFTDLICSAVITSSSLSFFFLPPAPELNDTRITPQSEILSIIV